MVFFERQVKIDLIAASGGEQFVQNDPYTTRGWGALKNAIDFLFAEWNDKAAGFVSYGSVGGSRLLGVAASRRAAPEVVRCR